jgi:hypothetical protein
MRTSLAFVLLCAQLAWLASTLRCSCASADGAASVRVPRAVAFAASTAAALFSGVLLFHRDAGLSAAVAASALASCACCVWYTIALTTCKPTCPPGGGGFLPTPSLGYVAAGLSLIAAICAASLYSGLSDSSAPIVAASLIRVDADAGVVMPPKQVIIIEEYMPRPRELARDLDVRHEEGMGDAEVKKLLGDWFREGASEPPAHASPRPRRRAPKALGGAAKAPHHSFVFDR